MELVRDRSYPWELVNFLVRLQLLEEIRCDAQVVPSQVVDLRQLLIMFTFLHSAFCVFLELACVPVAVLFCTLSHDIVAGLVNIDADAMLTIFNMELVYFGLCLVLRLLIIICVLLLLGTEFCSAFLFLHLSEHGLGANDFPVNVVDDFGSIQVVFGPYLVLVVFIIIILTFVCKFGKVF